MGLIVHRCQYLPEQRPVPRTLPYACNYILRTLLRASRSSTASDKLDAQFFGNVFVTHIALMLKVVPCGVTQMIHVDFTSVISVISLAYNNKLQNFLLNHANNH